MTLIEELEKLLKYAVATERCSERCAEDILAIVKKRMFIKDMDYNRGSITGNVVAFLGGGEKKLRALTRSEE